MSANSADGAGGGGGGAGDEGPMTKRAKYDDGKDKVNKSKFVPKTGNDKIILVTCTPFGLFHLGNCVCFGC